MAYISDRRCRTCCFAYNFDRENSFVSFDSSEETSSDCWSEEVESDMYQNGYRNNSSIYAPMEQKTYKYNGNSFQKFYDERTDYLSNKFNNLSLANDMSKNYSACPVHSKTNRKPMNKYTLEESYWAMWKPKNKTESNTSYQQPSMAKVESISKPNGSMLNTVNIGNVPMLSNVNMGNVSMISNVNMANMLSNVNMGKYVQCKNCFKYIERDNNKNYSTKCLCCAHKEFYETDTDSAAYRRNGTIQEDDEEETETQGYSGETTGFMTSEDYLTTTETQDYSARNQSDQSNKNKRKSSAASSRHASRQQSKTETLLEPKAIETQSGIISPVVVNQSEVEEGAYTWEQPELDKDQNDYQQGDSRNLVTSNKPYYDNYQNQSHEGNYSYNTDNYHNNQSSESGEYASTTNANYNYNVYNDNPNPSDTNASNTMNTNITNTATAVPTYNSSSYYDTLNTLNTNNNNENMTTNAPTNYSTSKNHNTTATNNLQSNANQNSSVPPNTPNYAYNPNVFKFSAPSALDAEVLKESEIKTINYEQKVDPAKEMITLKHTNSYIMKQKAEQAKFAQSNTVNAASKLSSGNRIAIRPHSYPLKPILKKDKKLVPVVRTTTASKNFGIKYKK
ncbi:PREDICTED: uncharacterized protein DDB_G0287625-like [Nicrophorus vespilloides]|uniref:Uncharacterized protein DDB_G0287625-like n=1 Tax=Nicrophorus vespilloides TaxID=110193 RepID=A0ABM1MH44_NICVS|nr:PREDICTED: uncharacterized protein DDB_G0287625-like [Nicrophorus vespilloides]